MRARTGAGAHDPHADPATADVTIATIQHVLLADDAALATFALAAATGDADIIITIAGDVARARATAEPTHAGAACVAGARGGRAARAGRRAPHQPGGQLAQLAAKVDAGRLTGADLFFLAFKASRY